MEDTMKIMRTHFDLFEHKKCNALTNVSDFLIALIIVFGILALVHFVFVDMLSYFFNSVIF